MKQRGIYCDCLHLWLSVNGKPVGVLFITMVSTHSMVRVHKEGRAGQRSARAKVTLCYNRSPSRAEVLLVANFLILNATNLESDSTPQCIVSCLHSSILRFSLHLHSSRSFTIESIVTFLDVSILNFDCSVRRKMKTRRMQVCL